MSLLSKLDFIEIKVASILAQDNYNQLQQSKLTRSLQASHNKDIVKLKFKWLIWSGSLERWLPLETHRKLERIMKSSDKAFKMLEEMVIQEANAEEQILISAGLATRRQREG